MNNKKRPEIINLLILSLIVVVFWIFFSVYRVFLEKSPAIVPPEVILPIDPKFDIETLEKAKTRGETDFLPENLVTPESVPEITPEPSPDEDGTMEDGTDQNEGTVEDVEQEEEVLETEEEESI